MPTSSSDLQLSRQPRLVQDQHAKQDSVQSVSENQAKPHKHSKNCLEG